MARNAFLDPVTRVLKGHGFCETNEPGDVIIDVPDTFGEKPGTVKRVGQTWAPYVAPKSAREADRDDAQAKIDAVLGDTKMDAGVKAALAAIRKVL